MGEKRKDGGSERGERAKKRKREEEKEENKTGSVTGRCEGFVSVEAFQIFSQRRDRESCGESFLAGPLMGYGEEKGNPSIQKLDLWIKILEKLHLKRSTKILVEVKQAKVSRTQKYKKEMSHFEKFVTYGNEQADELAKARAMFDEGFIHGASKSKNGPAM